jgi:transposase
VPIERDMLSDVRDIAECLACVPHPIEQIAFEAGRMSPHLFFGLTAEGFDGMCMDARHQTPTKSSSPDEVRR